MKKLLVTSMMLFSLLGSSQVHAALPVADVLNSVSHAVSALNGKITAVKTAAMDAFNKSSMVKELKVLWDSYNQLKDNLNELMGFRDDFMNTMSGLRNTNISDYKNKGNESVNYDYAAQLPQSYVGVTTCSEDGTCDSSSNFTGNTSGITSTSIRDAWHVPEGVVSEIDVRRLTYEAAEEYAQQIAVIQAIAQEAYSQATNRVAKIEELQQKLDGAATAQNTQSVRASAGTTPIELTTNAVNLSTFSAPSSSASLSSMDGASQGTMSTTSASGYADDLCRAMGMVV